MNIHPDFEDLFRLLEEHCVDYMIVGDYAVAFHGYPRFTKDIDVFFESSSMNIARLRAALIALLEEAIREFQRCLLLKKTNEAYARLKQDPDAWREEVEERGLWETTLKDGIE